MASMSPTIARRGGGCTASLFSTVDWDMAALVGSIVIAEVSDLEVAQTSVQLSVLDVVGRPNATTAQQ